MNRHSIYIVTVLLLLGFSNYGIAKNKTAFTETKESITPINKDFLKVSLSIKKSKNPEDFVPKDYVVFEKIYGDLNKDGLEDCVVIIKGTDESFFVEEEYSGKVDRNRRGIIILFNTKDGYELASKNYNCFASENEDGGVYFAPELFIEIKKGILYIKYDHGRYGNWKYTFRYQNSDFELIGFDITDSFGPTIVTQTSINYSTKKKLIRNNTNTDFEEGKDVFEESIEDIEIENLLKLSEIESIE